jgi:hypothetical protein
MHKSATKCNETIGKWCKNKHGASKIIDTFETYQSYKVKKLYVKQNKPAPAPVGPIGPDSFMRDARTSVPSGKFVSKDVPKRVKKLSWFQKHVLCMKVEIHRENYDAYCERKTILDTQREIIHKLSGDQAALSPPTPPIAYNKWHSETYDWGTMESSLYVGCTTRVDDEDEEKRMRKESLRKMKKRRRTMRKTRTTTTLSDFLGRVVCSCPFLVS